MSVQNIRDIHEMSGELADIIQPGSELEDWVEDKISASRQMVSDLHRFYTDGSAGRVAFRHLTAGAKTAGARFDAGGPWQAEDEDGRYYDVTIDKSDMAGIGKLFDTAWKKHWAKAMKKLELGILKVIPRDPPLSPDNYEGVRVVYEYAFGDVDKDEGNLAGDVWAAVYYDRSGGIEDVAHNHFSGRGGDSPDLENFSLGLDDQVREELWSNAKDALRGMEDFPRKVVERWMDELRGTYWD